MTLKKDDQANAFDWFIDKLKKKNLPPLLTAESGDDSEVAEANISRKVMEERLQLLARLPSPLDLKLRGAMCYSPKPLPDKIKYICPVCHERTIYDCNKGSSRDEVDAINNIDYYRRLVKRLNDNGLDCKLDESSFCHKCGNEAKRNVFFLETKSAGVEKPYRAKLQSTNDLNLILEFITGENRHKGTFDEESPLKNYLPRISELLGIEVNPELKEDFRKICLAAVKQNGYALQYVPEKLKDREICLAALQNGGELEYIPEKLKDREMYLAALKQNGGELEYIPEKLKDREICLAAVKQNGYALQYVPGKLKDREICLAAVKQNGYALQYVPEKLKDREICLAAVKRNGYALQSVPEKLKDREICLAAVKQDPFAIKHVPEEFKTN